MAADVMAASTTKLTHSISFAASPRPAEFLPSMGSQLAATLWITSVPTPECSLQKSEPRLPFPPWESSPYWGCFSSSPSTTASSPFSSGTALLTCGRTPGSSCTRGCSTPTSQSRSTATTSGPGLKVSERSERALLQKRRVRRTNLLN